MPELGMYRALASHLSTDPRLKGRTEPAATPISWWLEVPVNHNPVVDRDLLEHAMSISGETSASVAITKALEEYIARRSPQAMRELAGKLGWNATYGCKRERSGE